MHDQLRTLRAELRTLPNQMTAIRIVLLPFLWVFALLHLPALVGIGTLLAFVTDVLDGYLARKLGQVSAFGSTFDSLADNLLIPSGLIWLWLLRPEVYRENLLICLIAIGLYLASLLVGIVKFRRFGNLHLRSKRIGAVATYVFAGHAFLADHYSPFLFAIAVGFFIFSAAEGLLLQLICTRVDEHMGSLFAVMRRRHAR